MVVECPCHSNLIESRRKIKTKIHLYLQDLYKVMLRDAIRGANNSGNNGNTINFHNIAVRFIIRSIKHIFIRCIL